MRRHTLSARGSQATPLILVGVSLALGVLFWFEPQAKSQASVPTANLTGKAIFTGEAAAPPPEAVEKPVVQKKKAIKRAARKKSLPIRHRRLKPIPVAEPVRVKPKALAKKPARNKAVPPLPAQSNPVPAEPGLIPPGAGSNLADFAWQDVMDYYETDQSKFALSQETSSENVSLRFLGIEKRQGFYVLKVAVDNSSDSDFFIDHFAVLNNGVPLESRTLFRVLVEAGNAREGYLLFKPPLKGMSVHIVLEEDGGKSRRLSLPLALPF